MLTDDSVVLLHIFLWCNINRETVNRRNKHLGLIDVSFDSKRWRLQKINFSKISHSTVCKLSKFIKNVFYRRLVISQLDLVLWDRQHTLIKMVKATVEAMSG